MSERVIDRVADMADQFKEQAVEAEKLGQLPEATVKTMKSIGSIRLLQPERHGGLAPRLHRLEMGAGALRGGAVLPDRADPHQPSHGEERPQRAAVLNGR